MKKIIAILLLISTLLFTLTGCALFGGKNEGPAEGTPKYYILHDQLVKPSQNSLFRYKIYEHYVSISEYVGDESNVVIPDKIDDLPVYVIEEGAFADSQSLYSLTLSKDIVQIGIKAFSNCPLLKNITLPKTLTDIADNAFYNCSSLEEIILPETVETIGISAFQGCSSLYSISIPSKVSTVGNNVFVNCKNLKKVIFMDGIIADENNDYVETVNKTLGSNLFTNCTSLEMVLIPDTVTTIDDYAFEGMSSTAYIYGYVPSATCTLCANKKVNFIEVVEGDDKDRQMKDRSIIVPETTAK